MRKPAFLVLFILAGLLTVVVYLFTAENKQDSIRETSYLIDLNETIGGEEAEAKPPIERWKVIKDLNETTSIDVICHPSGSNIVDPEILRVMVGAMQDSEYVAASEYPASEPDVKVYFRKKDGFVMAGRLHVGEGILSSPEGPLIKVDVLAVKRLLENAGCNF
jgi:hypothetical protein